MLICIINVDKYMHVHIFILLQIFGGLCNGIEGIHSHILISCQFNAVSSNSIVLYCCVTPLIPFWSEIINNYHNYRACISQLEETYLAQMRPNYCWKLFVWQVIFDIYSSFRTLKPAASSHHIYFHCDLLCIAGDICCY